MRGFVFDPFELQLKRSLLFVQFYSHPNVHFFFVDIYIIENGTKISPQFIFSKEKDSRPNLDKKSISIKYPRSKDGGLVR